MTAEDLDEALYEALLAGHEPAVFKVQVDARFGLRPAPGALRRGVPIDVTSSPSALLCEDGYLIPIQGEW